MQALLTVEVARAVSLARFGEYSALLALGAVCMGFASFGYPNLILRLRRTQAIAVALAAIVSTVIASMPLAAVLVLYWAVAGIKDGLILFCAVAFTISEMVSNVIQSILYASLLERASSIYLIVRRFVPVLLVTVLLVSGPEGRGAVFQWLGVAYVILTVASIIWIHFTVGYKWQRLPRRMLTLLHRGRPYWLTSVATMLQQLDVTLINAFVGADSAGAYAAAFRLASPVHIVTTSILSRAVPAVANSPRSRAGGIFRSYRRMMIGYAAALAVLSPVVYFVGPELFGSEFYGWGLLFAIMFINSALNAVAQLQTAGLFLFAEGTWSVIANWLSLVVGLLGFAAGAAFGSVWLFAIGAVSIQITLTLLQQGRLRGALNRWQLEAR